MLGSTAKTEPRREYRDLQPVPRSPHQLVRINLLAVKRRAYCFQEIAAAAQPNELSPAVIIGMPVGADTSPTDPAVIRARDMRAEVAGGIDLVATPSGEPHAGGEVRQALVGEVRIPAHIVRPRAYA